MAFESNYVTMIGNLTEDPELRFTGGGAAVCKIRFASNRRYKTRDGQDQEETTFMDANCWRDMAENVAESLHKGDRVIVIGRLRKRSYENRDNQTVWVTEIEADEISPSLRWAQASVRRSSAGSGGQRSQGSGGSSSGDDGAWGDANVPPPSDEVPF